MTDTLSCDTILLREFRESGAYNYGAELNVPEKSLLEWLVETIDNWIGELLDNTFGSDGMRPFVACVTVALILVVMYLVYRYKPGLFRREGRNPVRYTVTEDTIYGIDFDAETARALSEGDYNEAVRLVYLHTLRWLSDNEKINWQIYKTPTQYLHEVDTPQFRRLTDTFIRVRYGNYQATPDTVSVLQALRRHITEGGEA